MNWTLLLADGIPDPVSASMDWVISRGLVGGALVVIFILGMVVKQLYSDNSALRDRVEKMQENHKNEVVRLAQDTTVKVETLMEKQVDLVEKVVETQADTNATLRSLRIVPGQA